LSHQIVTALNDHCSTILNQKGQIEMDLLIIDVSLFAFQVAASGVALWKLTNSGLDFSPPQ